MILFEKMFAYPLVWNYKKEIVYKLLDKIEYINNFFETGELLISCFAKFKKCPNEFQGDKEEGDGIVVGKNEKGDISMIGFDSGINAYVFSTTTKNTDKMKSDFKAVGAIKINEPTQFAIEIAKKLSFVSSGVEGYCDYIDSRIQWLKDNSDENKRFQKLDFKNDPNSYENFRTAGADGSDLFLKSKSYEYQSEYRLIWFTDERKKIKESVVIYCPEAIKYCEKIIFKL